MSDSGNRSHKQRVQGREAGSDSHQFLQQASSSSDRNKEQDLPGLQVQPSRAIHWKHNTFSWRQLKAGLIKTKRLNIPDERK